MTRPRTRRALGTALTGRVAFTPRRNFSGGRVGEMRGVCCRVEVDLGLMGRGCKCQRMKRVPRNSLHAARSRNNRHRTRSREIARSSRAHFAVGTDTDRPTPPDCPPVALTGLHVVDAAGRSRKQAAPSANAFRGARWSHHHAVVCMNGPTHSPSRCWNSETLRPKQSSTLGQEVNWAGG